MTIRFLLSIFLVASVIVSGCGTAAPTTQQGLTPADVASSESNLLPVTVDSETGRLHLTVTLDEEMLYFTTLAGGMGTQSPLLDRGQVGSSSLVRFERHGPRVLMVQVNTRHQWGEGDEALRRSVEESFANSVLASFSVEREDGAAVVIDATDFFLSDAFDVAGSLRRAQMGNARLDRDRSYVSPSLSRSFVDNSEVRAVLTFSADDAPWTLRRYVPDPRGFTVQQHHSFLRLPDEPMDARPFDPRAGLWAATHFDFSQPFDADYRQRGTVRWRLEPSDPEAYLRGELVEPTNPIVYYMDPAIPEPYRTAFFEGGMWWNGVFEAAGWKNAFRIEDLPEGVDMMDVRYPAIVWVHREERGPSVGPSFRDPRTGEILGTNVRMDSYRSLVNHDIYMGLVPGGGNLAMSAEDFAMARRMQHTAHEIGHTLGLSHNFIAATQDRASVMDYPYPLIRISPDGTLDISEAYAPHPGAHDTLAIKYGYTWFPDARSEGEGLRQIIREAEARGLRFIGDAHVSAGDSYPSVSQWIEGEDMLLALDRTMNVRRVLMDSFDERAAQAGEPLAILNRRFAHVYLHHRYAIAGATKYIGGMEFGFALRGEDTVPTMKVPADEQRAALSVILDALQPSELHIPQRIVSLLPPIPMGYDGDLTLINTPSGSAFDPVHAAHSLAQEIVDGILHPHRMNRVASFHAQDASYPSVDEVINELISATWGQELGALPALRRVAQRAVLDGLLDLAGNGNASVDVRADAEHQLTRLRASLGDSPHEAKARRDIDRYLDGRDHPEARARPARIPLPWP
jgi:hypothetical protein